MIKIRIYDIAEELKVDSKKVLEITNGLGIVVKSVSSTVNYKDAQAIMRYITNELRHKILQSSKIKIIRKGNKAIIDDSLLKARTQLLFKALQSRDYEISEMLVAKISVLRDIEDKLDAILEDVMYGNYETALEKLSKYLNTEEISISIVSYEDKGLDNLKKELKSLESTLQTLVEQKTECLNDIEEFNREYNLRLGDGIRSILNLRKEILYKKIIKQQKLKAKYQEDLQTFKETQRTIDELKDTITELEEALETIDESHEQYDEIRKAYEELFKELNKLEEELDIQEQELEEAKGFIEDETIEEEYENSYEQIKESLKDVKELSDDEKSEIKKLYKKAARLYHPDIVPNELKEKANEMMQLLNEAYAKKDLQKVKDILHSLENGTVFERSSDTIEDKDLLIAKIEEYRQNIKHIESELEELRQDDTYQMIAEIDDWNGYFEELKSELEVEKQKLEEEMRRVFGEKEILYSEEQIIKINDEAHNSAPGWMHALWEWADANHVINGRIPRKAENLSSLKVLDLAGQKLNYLPDEIVNLQNLVEISLWDCGLRYLPKSIIELNSLKKLNLRTNPELILTRAQEQWIEDLKHVFCIVYKDSTLTMGEINDESQKRIHENLQEVSHITYDEQCKIVLDWMVSQFQNIYKVDLTKEYKACIRAKDITNQVVRDLQNKGSSKIELRYLVKNMDFVVRYVDYETFGILSPKKPQKVPKPKTKAAQETPSKIHAEYSPYASHIKSIEVPNFEKIRRYCNNLVDENKADEMQKYFAENGRMHKAMMYDALEQFIAHLDGKEITLIDWGCGQGIASMLVLDYIREKQLNIKLNKLFLMASSDTKDALDRAFAHIDVLKQNITKVYGTTVVPCPEECSDETQENYNESVNFELNLCVNDVILHLFANDDIPFDFQAYDWFNFSFDVFNGYFLCISNDYEFDIDYIPKQIGSIEMLSVRDDKIGRFKRYERIFKSDRIEENILSKNHTSVIDLDEIPF
jgi:Leucine-rich repeat (LRR) protein